MLYYERTFWPTQYIYMEQRLYKYTDAVVYRGDLLSCQCYNWRVTPTVTLRVLLTDATVLYCMRKRAHVLDTIISCSIGFVRQHCDALGLTVTFTVIVTIRIYTTYSYSNNKCIWFKWIKVKIALWTFFSIYWY